jgi:hypothetical protein
VLAAPPCSAYALLIANADETASKQPTFPQTQSRLPSTLR